MYKQPLFHFLLLGLLLFLIFDLTATTRPAAGKTIVVDREKLLTHLQFRSKAFDTGQFETTLETTLETLSPEKRSALIESYVQEEALYRESLSFGLDVNDYVIRQRLIQKVEYLASAAQPQAQVNIEDFYEKNKDNYYIQPTFTFTHIFLNRENYESVESGKQAASTLLKEVVSEGVDLSGAMQFGDRFVFHKNYVGRTQDFVASHFGEGFARIVSEAETNNWFGPVESAYGFHLVLIRDNKEGRTPPLEEIIANVAYDSQQVASRRQTRNAINNIVQKYEVIVDF